MGGGPLTPLPPHPPLPPRVRDATSPHEHPDPSPLRLRSDLRLRPRCTPRDASAARARPASMRSGAHATSPRAASTRGRSSATAQARHPDWHVHDITYTSTDACPDRRLAVVAPRGNGHTRPRGRAWLWRAGRAGFRHSGHGDGGAVSLLSRALALSPSADLGRSRLARARQYRHTGALYPRRLRRGPVVGRLGPGLALPLARRT